MATDMQTYSRMLYEAVQTDPYKLLVISDQESVTYGAAYLFALQVSKVLTERYGIGEGDTVVLTVANCVQYPALLAGIQMSGARLAMLPVELQRSEFRSRMELVRPTLFIMSSLYQCQLVQEELPDARVITSQAEVEGFDFLDALASREAASLVEVPRFIDHPLISAVFSSGSTGVPKAIANQDLSFSYNGTQLRKSLRLGEDDVIYIPVPFNHVFGMVGLYATIVSHATAVTSVKFRAESALALMESTNATMMFGVPTMFSRVFREKENGLWDLSSLRAGLVAGADCPAQVVIDFEERLGVRLLPSYGMSETAATLTMTNYDDEARVRAASIGFPIDGAAMKLDPNTGEILCKTPSMMVGILRPSGVCELDLDEDGWFHSGDVATYDPQLGYTIVGRLKDMIIRGGINIFPREVEELYLGNPEVAECYLVGYPDHDLGERTCLCARMAPGAHSSSRQLREYALGNIAKFKVPDVVFKMDEFPRLGSGKIDKISLRKRVEETFSSHVGGWQI